MIVIFVPDTSSCQFNGVYSRVHPEPRLISFFTAFDLLTQAPFGKLFLKSYLVFAFRRTNVELFTLTGRRKLIQA